MSHADHFVNGLWPLADCGTCARILKPRSVSSTSGREAPWFWGGAAAVHSLDSMPDTARLHYGLWSESWAS